MRGIIRSLVGPWFVGLGGVPGLSVSHVFRNRPILIVAFFGSGLPSLVVCGDGASTEDLSKEGLIDELFEVEEDRIIREASVDGDLLKLDDPDGEGGLALGEDFETIKRVFLFVLVTEDGQESLNEVRPIVEPICVVDIVGPSGGDGHSPGAGGVGFGHKETRGKDAIVGEAEAVGKELEIGFHALNEGLRVVPGSIKAFGV